MGSFKLTNKAKTDLIGIAKYTEIHWGKEQRNFYLKQFDDVFYLIAGNPLIGIECNYIKNNYHKFLHGSHLIFYKVVATNKIEIIRILHKRMDVLTKFD